MAHSKQFNVLIRQDEDGFFVATVPSLPGCHTQAKNLNILRKRIRESIELCLDVAKTDKAYRNQISLGEPAFVGLETVLVWATCPPCEQRR